MAQKRKYYRISATRIPPHSWVNCSYPMEEDVYAYSVEGAENTFNNYHKSSYGGYLVEDIREITKEEFRGHHTTMVLPRE